MIWFVIIVFVVLAFLVKKIILWIIDLRKLKKENWQPLEQVEISLKNVGDGFVKAKITLALIERNYSEAVWKENKRVFGLINLDDTRDEFAQTKIECERSIFWAKEAKRTLNALIFELKQDQKVVDVINNLSGRILIAQAAVNKILNEILPMIYEMDTLLTNDNLANGLKGYYERAKANFWQLKEEFDSLCAKPTDWLDFETRFTKVFDSIKVARKNSKS